MADPLRTEDPRVGDRVRRGAQRLTASLRPLPDFVIIGAQKGGTTSLFNYLSEHPAVVPAIRKEVHFFDLAYHMGPAWYRSHFPTRMELGRVSRAAGSRAVTGEASPYYLFHPAAPERLHALMPQAKLLVLLRDPVERAVSHHHHEHVIGQERLSFAEAVDAELERTRVDRAALDRETQAVKTGYRHHSYLSRGHYAEQLERWLAFFPREQLWIRDSADMFAEPGAVLADACRFIGVPEHGLDRYEAALSRSYDGIDPALRDRLREHFAPHNERLFALLGRDLGWND